MVLLCRSVARERVLNLPLPWMITQQSSFELCFAISSPVSFTACVSLLSWFIVANGVCPSCVVRGYRRTMLYRCVVWSQDISAIVVQMGIFHKDYKDGRRAANQSTSNEKETQIGAANLSTVDPRSRRIQPACSPEAVFKSRGCHASPLFTPKLYLHNLLFCPIGGLGLLFPTHLSDFVISGNAERLRANSPR
jgi:hypothetical protein